MGFMDSDVGKFESMTSSRIDSAKPILATSTGPFIFLAQRGFGWSRPRLSDGSCLAASECSSSRATVSEGSVLTWGLHVDPPWADEGVRSCIAFVFFPFIPLA